MDNRRATTRRSKQREEIDALRRRLAEAEDTLQAIREGEVDAIVVSGKGGNRIFTLDGSDQVYRLIVETMKEAALTVTLDGTILFCNGQFGHFLGLPPADILGHALGEFVAPEQGLSIPDLLTRSVTRPVKQRLVFQSAARSAVPAHVSSNVLSQPDDVSICIVASDLRELEASTEMLQQLRRQQDALLESESRLRAVFSVSPDAIVIADDEGRCLETNPAADRLFGLTEAEAVIGKKLSDFVDPGCHFANVWTDMKKHGRYQGEGRIVRSDGTVLLAEMFAAANIRPSRHLAVLRDITDQRRAEEALETAHNQLEQKVQERTAELTRAEAGLRRSNQILEMFSDCNEVIVRIDDEQELMEEICRVIVEVGCYLLAWVGLAENDEHKTVRPAAHAGFETGYLEKARISWADTKRGRGPTGAAIRTGKVQFGRDYLHDPSLAPWRKDAIKRGFRSSIALPLRERDAVLGALTIYASTEDAFGDPQAKILGELADDLAFGLVAARTRKALRESRDLLRALAGELTLTEQRERQRMAKMLHDHIQQLLAGAKFQIHALGGAGDLEVKKRAKEVEELLRECINASRTLTAELSPPIPQEGGLVGSLEWLAEWMCNRHGLCVELNMQNEDVPVQQDVKLLLFESTRELLLNVAKHARVKSASVGLQCVGGDRLQVVVSDEGIGFDPDRLNAGITLGDGFGLFSIRERMNLMGGQLEIASRPGRGSRFTLTVPLTASLRSWGNTHSDTISI